MEEIEHFAFKFPLDTFFDKEGWEDMYPHWEIKLYIDEENMVEIINFLLSEEGARKKLKDIFNIMFSGTYEINFIERNQLMTIQKTLQL